jgi:hypothetical protein
MGEIDNIKEEGTHDMENLMKKKYKTQWKGTPGD